MARSRSISLKTLLLCWLGLCLFLAWQAVALHRYNQIDTRPPPWDQAVHMEIAWDYLHALKAGRFSDILFLPPKPGMPPFPPLYHLGLMASYASSDPAHAALWLNWFFLVLLCGTVFGIALHFRNDETALIAVIVFACTPSIQYLLHTQLIDLSLVALAACAYWALLSSDHFHRRGASLLLGGIHAAGMLAKWSFFSYMIPLYLAAFWALDEPKRRENALLAASFSAVLFMPWYWVHLPVLLPRLFQATADNAIPFWKSGAPFKYLVDTCDGLGPPLWLLGWIGLVVPITKSRRENVWILLSWVFTSYLFWTIVPNRQLRFLMPGLPALAVLALGAWPKPILWALAAFQLFAAGNFTTGRMETKTILFPSLPLNFFTSQPPAHEDWKIPEILREAQRLRPQDSPFSNLTLVANNDFFNGPTFNWEVKWLGLSDSVQIRGVNRRLCEFSEFVVLKKGNLGPAGATSGLPEAARLIEDKEKWFQRAYETAGSWPLPDGSEAVLYRQKILKSPPFSGMTFHFPSYSVPTAPFAAKNLKIALDGWDTRRSLYASIVTTTDRMELRGLPIRNLKVEFQDALVVPGGEHPNQQPWEDVRFLKAKTLRVISLQLTADDLKKFIESRAKGLRITRIGFNDGIRIAALFRRVPLSAEAKLYLARPPHHPSPLQSAGTPESLGKFLVFELEKAKIGSVSIPVGLIGRYRRFSVPLDPNPETPFAIEVAGLTLRNDKFSIP